MTPPEAVMSHISPLTRVSTTGELYTRRPEVEGQLQDLARNGFAFDLNALNNRDRDSDGYLYDETLVYLFRRAVAIDDSTIEPLYTEINRRTMLKLRKIQRDYFESDPNAFEEFSEDVCGRLLRKLLDIGSNSADFAQVMFGRYVVRLGMDVIKKMKRSIVIEVLEPLEGGGDPIDLLFAANDLPEIDRILIGEALSELRPQVRRAAILRFTYGLPVETNPPSAWSVSVQMKVTGRTVRNWLREAVQVLAEFEGLV